jgi:hypothetical protein
MKQMMHVITLRDRIFAREISVNSGKGSRRRLDGGLDGVFALVANAFGPRIRIQNRGGWAAV